MKSVIKESFAVIKVRSPEDLHELYSALRPYVMNPYIDPSNFIIKLFKQIKDRLKSYNIIVD